MGFIGHNCSDCSHSLLPKLCSIFAATLLTEFGLVTVGLFGRICGFDILEGICDANGVFKYVLTVDL